MVKEILPEDQHKNIDDIVKYKRIEFIETSRNMQVFEGVETILTYLKNKRISICLATSADKSSVMRVMNKFGLTNHFDIIISSNDVKEAKPNPEMFIKASKKLELDPNKCLVVGDSPFDVIAARKAGMNIIIIDNNPFQRQEIQSYDVPVITDINQLKDYI